MTNSHSPRRVSEWRVTNSVLWNVMQNLLNSIANILQFIFTLLCIYTVFGQFNKGDYLFFTICNVLGVTGGLATKLAFVCFKVRHIEIIPQSGPYEISRHTFHHSKNITFPLRATKIKKKTLSKTNV